MIRCGSCNPFENVHGRLIFDYRIIKVPFTGSVRLRSVLLKAGPGDQTPKKVHLVCMSQPGTPRNYSQMLISSPTKT